MKISVIVPVYNCAQYFPTCLDSILAQTYQELEVILVDDGSSDGSEQICDDYKRIDHRVHVIHQQNRGVSAARNRGLAVMTGDLVSFIDSDDELEPDMYEFLVNLMQEYGADIAHCGYKRLNEQRKILKEVSGTHMVILQTPAEAIDCMLSGRYFVGGLWNKLFSTKCVQKLSFCTDLKNNEDILFNAMAFQNALRIVFADETKYLYFEHTSSACNKLAEEKKVRDRVLASQSMLNYCQDPESRSAVQRWRFTAQSNFYRFLLFQKNSDQAELRATKIWLKENYSATVGLERKTKINYWLMVYGARIYRTVYRIYNAVRKPNWDVK